MENQWNITMFIGYIHCKWSFSIAMLSYQRVSLVGGAVFSFDHLREQRRPRDCDWKLCVAPMKYLGKLQRPYYDLTTDDG